MAPLLVKDVLADAGNGLLVFRPVGFDVGRMKKQSTLQGRCMPLIVDRFGYFPGALPRLAAWLLQFAELGPRKDGHITPAYRIPVLLIDDVANRSGVKRSGLAIHRDFCHAILTGRGLAACF